MSAIPPSVIGSVLQSPAAQNEQSRPAEAARNTQLDAARKLAGTPGDVLEVEETDSDSRVHTDSGGAGGQGRQDAPPEEEDQEQQEESSGLHVDDQGIPHLDISA
jgi:hypothetical protein